MSSRAQQVAFCATCGVEGSAVVPVSYTHLDVYKRQVHAQGLKFGVHIVRGIPRDVVNQNLPIAGTSFHAADAADINDKCPWDEGNFGVADNAAGQAYYDGMLKLYAGWGLDYIKVDCIKMCIRDRDVSIRFWSPSCAWRPFAAGRHIGARRIALTAGGFSSRHADFSFPSCHR